MMKWALGVLLLVAGCAHPPAPVVVAPAPHAPPPAPPPAEPETEMRVSGTLGTLRDEEIDGPFQRSWDDITRCYRDAQSRLSYLGGKIEVKVRVGGDGTPKRVFVSASTMGSYEAERCILQVARGLTFARPHGGTEAEFAYPIEFR